MAQQMEALRGYASQEGYEVLEEVSDAGQSGASLERPGMDRVRELVEAGGVSVVLAQDRDRIAREPAYHYLLKKEFEEHGCKIRALNDRGDDSPEGELTDGILDQLAKFERAKTAERARRGRLRKAREGKIIATHTPAYGFAYNVTRDGYLVNEETMPTVVRIFEYVAGGLSLRATAKAVTRDGVPSPTGKHVWSSYSVRAMILEDLYKPHTPEEIRELVQEELLTADVAGRLDPSRPYGVWWANTVRDSVRTVSESDEAGGRRYRKRRKTVPRPRTEWIAVPIDLTGSGLDREIVDLARSTIKDNVRPSSAGGRVWEVAGLVFCTCCGRKIHTHTTRSKDTDRLYYYYQCDNREGCDARPRLRAGDLEADVWQVVRSGLTDPDQLKAELGRMIELERSVVRGDPDREAKHWLERLSGAEEERRGFLRLAARGRITDEELDEELTAIEETRQVAKRELAALQNRKERIEALERDRDALLEDYAGRTPDALEALTSEERHQLYKMLRLSVKIHSGCNVEIAGALPESVPFLQTDSVSCKT
ncbi:MAG: recombinase family protein [Actinomycetota bacterium]|nr:recombinase family protein [Actinomycetota bacterium]